MTKLEDMKMQYKIIQMLSKLSLQMHSLIIIEEYHLIEKDILMELLKILQKQLN